MAEQQVTGVNKPDRNSPHEAITHLCGPPNWKLRRQEVVDRIKSKVDRFYTSYNGRRAYLEVRVSANGTEFVQTIADGTPVNNLLSLPECR